MRATDQMLARVASEIEEKQGFIDGLVEDAQKEGRDLNEQEMELVTRTRTRLGELNGQMEPLKEARRISSDSASKLAELAEFMREPNGDKPKDPEYNSPGAYVIERWRAQLGHEDSARRLNLFHRAAAHQTTGDNPGLLPDQVVGPVVNFVDQARPLVSALGPRQLPGANWSRPKVTQHTSIGEQTTQKSELVSQKMTIAKLAATPKTYGGYVNVSRQDIDWSQPQVMDIIINDLAAQYAILTEDVAADTFTAAAATGPTIPTGAPTAAAVTAAIWTAVGSVYAASKGAGRVIMVAPPQMLGLIGPLFAPVNPTNAQSPGFSAGDYGLGAVGQISGIPVYITPGMADNTMLVLSTAAAEVYEDRIGSLQVVEPSVLGVQVAYAGYFAAMPVEATAIVKIIKTP